MSHSFEAGPSPSQQVPVDHQGDAMHRIGVAKGFFVVPASIDQSNLEIARLFDGDVS